MRQLCILKKKGENTTLKMQWYKYVLTHAWHQDSFGSLKNELTLGDQGQARKSMQKRRTKECTKHSDIKGDIDMKGHIWKNREEWRKLYHWMTHPHFHVCPERQGSDTKWVSYYQTPENPVSTLFLPHTLTHRSHTTSWCIDNILTDKDVKMYHRD
jgi:hypothetical protein